MIAHGAADMLLPPAYLFRHPEFVWKALSARPIWEGVTSTSPGTRLTIVRALSPKHIFAGDPFQIFMIAAWVFVKSTLLAVFAFARAHFVKVRATHRYRTHFAPRANPRPELLAKTILIFGLAALLACLFPVQRASQVSSTHALRVQ
jgi:hypothetical protein